MKPDHFILAWPRSGGLSAIGMHVAVFHFDLWEHLLARDSTASHNTYQVAELHRIINLVDSGCLEDVREICAHGHTSCSLRGLLAM